VKAEEREASAAGLKLAGDIEFDVFRGKADFSNAGVFDGELSAIPALPNMAGLDVQIRQSDFLTNGLDQMFGSYGSDLSNIISGGGLLTQDMIEDANVRSAMNLGSADKFLADPLTISAYNKIVFGKERIMLAGSAQDATGGDLRRQWVSGGTVSVEASQFLRGKFKPTPVRTNSPVAPTVGSGSATGSGTSSSTGTYQYYVTAENENGESSAVLEASGVAVTAGQYVYFDITKTNANQRFFNVYRSAANGASTATRFIGRVDCSNTASGGTVTFYDKFNKRPGFVTGFLVSAGESSEGTPAMEMRELMPYSRLKLAVTSLTQPEAHFRFCCLTVPKVRHQVIVDNLVGSL
jgi:hypothetical protein